MNRFALLTLATLSGGGAVYAVWLAFTQGDMSAWGQVLRVAAAIAILTGAFITWEGVLNGAPARNIRLKRTAAAMLVLGIVGVGVNAVVGMTTKAPDGPVFVISMVLVLQAFLTIGFASRDN